MRKKPAHSAGFDISGFVEIHHDPPTSTELSPECFGYYRAYKKGTKDEIGQVQYRLPLVDENDDELLITKSYIAPQWRRKKIASALIEQLHRDYPDYFVDVGRDNPDDLEEPAFYYYLRDTLPDYRDTVIQEGARDDRGGLDESQA